MTKLQAEIMKRPRHAASIRYSCQWLDRAVREGKIAREGRPARYMVTPPRLGFDTPV